MGHIVINAGVNYNYLQTIIRIEILTLLINLVLMYNVIKILLSKIYINIIII